MSKVRKKKHWWEDDWEQVWINVPGSNVVVMDPKKERQPIACCDCGAVHQLDLTVLKDGKVKVQILYSTTATRYLRKTDKLEFKECRKCKRKG